MNTEFTFTFPGLPRFAYGQHSLAKVVLFVIKRLSISDRHKGFQCTSINYELYTRLWCSIKKCK